MEGRVEVEDSTGSLAVVSRSSSCLNSNQRRSGAEEPCGTATAIDVINGELSTSLLRLTSSFIRGAEGYGQRKMDDDAASMSSYNMSNDVDICFTCLTDNPPRLPLREELPSLGVEVIYRAHGIGSKASQLEARKAVQNYLYKQQAKDLKKRRFFPKSSKHIKSLLAERRRMEHELNLPRALSYESYQRELQGENLFYESDGKSKSSGTVSSGTRATSADEFSMELANQAILKGKSTVEKALKRLAVLRGRLSMGRTTKTSAVAMAADGKSTASADSSKTRSIAELLGHAAFDDLLAPRDENGGKYAYESDRDTASSIGSPSRDRSSSLSRDHFPNMEVQFVTSAVTRKHLPNLNTVNESDNGIHQTSSMDSDVAAMSVIGFDIAVDQQRTQSQRKEQTALGSDASVPISVEDHMETDFTDDEHGFRQQQHDQQQQHEVSTMEIMSKFEESYIDWMGASSNIFDGKAASPKPPSTAVYPSRTGDAVYKTQASAGSSDALDNVLSSSPGVFDNVPDTAYWGQDSSSSEKQQKATMASSKEGNATHPKAKSPTTTPGDETRLVIHSTGVFDSFLDPIYTRTRFTSSPQPHKANIMYSESNSILHSTSESHSIEMSTNRASSRPQSPKRSRPQSPKTPNTPSERKLVQSEWIKLSPSTFGEAFTPSSDQVLEKSPRDGRHGVAGVLDTPPRHSLEKKKTDKGHILNRASEVLRKSQLSREKNKSTNKSSDGREKNRIVDTPTAPLEDERSSTEEEDSLRGSRDEQETKKAPRRPGSEEDSPLSPDNQAGKTNRDSAAVSAAKRLLAAGHSIVPKSGSGLLHETASMSDDENSNRSRHSDTDTSRPKEKWRVLPRLPTASSDEDWTEAAPSFEDLEITSSLEDFRDEKAHQGARMSPQRIKTGGHHPRHEDALEMARVRRSSPSNLGKSTRQDDSQKKRKKTSKHGVDKRKGESTDQGFNWLETARSALETVAAGVVIAAHSLVRDDTKAPSRDGEDPATTELSFTRILTRPDTSISQIQKMLRSDPSLVRMRQPNGWFPLHVLCNKPLPDRSTANENQLTDHLVQDILVYIRQLDLVYTAYTSACQSIDTHGDLPVHLLARNLMKWETQWYETVYNQAAIEKNASGKAAIAITRLYHLMSDCIEMILRPLVLASPELCSEAGSVGRLLPLHIAAIFTASVQTQRLVLEAFPDAARETCDVSKLETFVPDKSLPIELHDSLSTDFPKWETETTTDPLMKWSKSRSSSSGLDDCIRRSDLLFAYNPDVDPYRFDKARIRRFESRIQFEAKFLTCEKRASISRASERLWLWLCTFRDPKTGKARYVTSVKGIVESLSPSLVELLAMIPTSDGRLIIDVAHPMCASVIKWRLQERPDPNEVSLLKPSASTLETPPGESPTRPETQDISPVKDKAGSLSPKQYNEESLKDGDQRHVAKASFGGRNCIGFLCRTLFNVLDDSIPTSFIILPYKLSRSEGGRLGMASPDSAPIAVKFAECLIKLTDPRSIIYHLDAKSTKYFMVSIYDEADDEKSLRRDAFEKIKGFENALLSLYEPGVAYLYLLDEETGVPIVPASGGGEKYPILINEPVNMVRKLMGLMLLGMIQMRGERAISVLSTILMDPNVTVVPPNWIIAAKELGAHLHHKNCADADKKLEYKHVRDGLDNFISSSAAKRKRPAKAVNGSTEWNVELSILKMMLEMHDPKHTYSGLEAQQEENYVLWSAAKNSSDDVGNEVKEIINLANAPDGNHGGPKSSTPARSTQQHDKSDGESSSETIDVLYFPDSSDASSRDMDFFGGDNSVSSSPSLREEAINTTLKYSMLFDELAVKELPAIPETREPEFETVRLWDAADRVWVDVTCQLNRSGMFWDDRKVLKLKVGLAEQAKKLAFLQKKLVNIKEEEMRVHQRQQHMSNYLNHGFEDIWDEQAQPHTPGVVNARKLLLRLCSLEERILCNQIELQHVTMDSFALNEHIQDLYISPFDEEEERDKPPSSPDPDSEEAEERLMKSLENPRERYLPNSKKRDSSPVPSEIEVSPSDLYKDDDLSESTAGAGGQQRYFTGRVEV